MGCTRSQGAPNLKSAEQNRNTKEAVVRIVATAEIKGTTEPCGCNSDPLGDVARIATLAQGALWVDAGSLRYDPETKSAQKKAQADLKAAALSEIYSHADVNEKAGAFRIHEIQGVKVGVFSVVDSAGANDVAARSTVGALKSQGARVIVALMAMPRAKAHALMSAVPGISFGIVGAEVGEGMPEAAPAGSGYLVAPADQGQRVAVVELHVIDGNFELRPFAGEEAQRAAAERLQRKIALLELQLLKWKSDPHADAAFVNARTAALANMRTERTRLLTSHPTPPQSSYFTYALTPVKRSVPRDTTVAERLQKLDRDIGQANLQAAQRVAPMAPAPGQSSYVGMAACEKCHKEAVAFWKSTVHAGAWKALTSVDKQYNYDCIGCHVTGLSQPGGPTLATVEKAGLVNVQCEVCHGPGSKHVAEAGLEDPQSMIRSPASSFCADQCHTKEHSDTFELDAYLRDILGKGHGQARRTSLGPGATGHELRQKALASASGK